MSTRHQIVIVGGGAGGLELATKLGNTLGRKKLADITLIDGSLTHFWKPLLHEVAAGTLNVHADELSYFAHAHAHYFEFRVGYMDQLDRSNKTLSLAPTHSQDGKELIPRRTFSYDSLVIAVGSETNDFGTQGVDEHCLFLDSQKQAQRFQRALLEKWFIACTQKTPLRPGQLNIAIAGAGATGVELAAELHTAVNELTEHGFDAGKEYPIQFTLIDAADRVLPALPRNISDSVTRSLQQLGIKLMSGELIEKATPEGFYTRSGQFIASEIKVWAAGVKAPDWLANLDGLETNRINQLMVRSTLQTTLDDDVFALGDCACCPQPNSDRPVPPRAQAAHQQASAIYDSLLKRLQNKPPVEFVYDDQGSLINLSRHSTVGNLMGNLFGKTSEFKIEGFLARYAYMSLYKMHQRTLHGFWWVALMTTANLITRRIRPRMKLH